MPVEIVRNDIVNMQVDAIVNTASIQPVIGYGVDSGIHAKAGPRLLAARKRIGAIAPGTAAVTPAYDLNARYVIHTVCPVWRGGDHGEAELLRQCYDRSLALARRKWCKSIAFPLMAAGNHGFPKALALEIAMSAISSFLMKHEMQIYLVVFSRDAWQLSENLFRGVASYIDECYVREKTFSQYGVADKCDLRQEQQEAFFLQQRNLRHQQELAAALEEEDEDGLEPFEEGFPDLDWTFEEDIPDGAPAPMGHFAHDPDLCLPARDARREEEPEPLEEIAVSFDRAPRPQMAKKSAAPGPTVAPAQAMPKNLEAMLKAADAGFTETLFKMIDKTGKKDSEIYKKANIDRKHFSKIRKNKNYQPSKPTALAFAIALELDLEETRDFIGRAGFALSRSSTFDIIIEYFIINRNYNIHEINMTLFAFDQSLLGV